MPRTAAKTPVAFEAVSKDDKARMARSQLRVARVTAKYTGRREKRAKDAAEKEK